jgi:hypothetical protein
VVFSPQHLAERLTPYPLPTKDGGVFRIIGDARALRRSGFGRATDRTSRILETGNARLWSADDNPLMAFTFLRGCLLRAR